MANPLFAYGLAAVAAYLLLVKEDDAADSGKGTTPEGSKETKPESGEPEPEPEPEPESEPEAEVDPSAVPHLPEGANVVAFSPDMTDYRINHFYKLRVLDPWLANEWCLGKIVGKYDDGRAAMWKSDPDDFLGDGLSTLLLLEGAWWVFAKTTIVGKVGSILGQMITLVIGDDQLSDVHVEAMESTAAGALAKYMETMTIWVGDDHNFPINKLENTPATQEFVEFLMDYITHFQGRLIDEKVVCKFEE